MGEKYSKYKNLFESHHQKLHFLKKQFKSKFGIKHNFQKFKWQKSFRDNYIRDQKDFDNHRDYIYTNPYKHLGMDPLKYKYMFIHFDEIIDE